MSKYFVGLISGTSMDGIDAVVADFEAPVPRILAARTVGFEQSLRAELEVARQAPHRFPAGRLSHLDVRLGDAFADAALTVIEQADLQPGDISAVGSHGQTILHDPDTKPPCTLQVADPHRIAARTGILTIADFRRADLAAGGQGAPLAPLLHQALLASQEENRAVVNLGGIANLTVLPARGGVTGFDTGPANCLLDHWYRWHHEGPYDPNGRWAAAGHCNRQWLDNLLEDDYFQKSPPKSTGIEYFSPRWLRERLPDWASDRPADVQATLLALTVESTAQALKRLPEPDQPQRIITCGGGVHNHALMQQLGQHLQPGSLCSSAAFGLDPDQLEALLFAWLARERLAGRPVQTGPITGARYPVLAGVMVERRSQKPEPGSDHPGLSG